MTESDWRKQYPIGTLVLIIGDHPRVGEVGKIIKHSDFLGQPSVEVACNNGLYAGILYERHLKRIGGNG